MRKIGLATTIIFLIALLVSCVGLSGCGGNGNGDGNGGGTITELPGTYQFSIEYSESDGDTMTMEVWVREDGKARTDYWKWTTPGEPTETKIFISDGEFDWMYHPSVENTAYKWSLGSGMNPGIVCEAWFTGSYYGDYMTEGEILAAMQATCAANPKCASVTLDHETISEEYCTKFTWNYTNGDTYSFWIPQAHGWLAKWQYYEASEGVTTTMQFTDIDLDPTIPDDIFDVDKVFAPGTEIIDMTVG